MSVENKPEGPMGITGDPELYVNLLEMKNRFGGTKEMFNAAVTLLHIYVEAVDGGDAIGIIDNESGTVREIRIKESDE